MVISKKTDIQKQKQKKAKQQQQQQQKQNVKINIRLGEKPVRRRRRPTGKKQPPKPSPDLPVQFPTPQYVPMFINQYPSPYFTAPTPPSTIMSVSAPTSAISSILPSIPSTLPVTTPPIASLPPPLPPSFRPPPPPRPTIKPIKDFADFGIQTEQPYFTDFGIQTEQPYFTDFGIQTEQPYFTDFGMQTKQPYFTDFETQTDGISSIDFETQTEQPSFIDFGIQTEQPSAISETLRGMEMPRAQPPPPLERAQTEPTRPPLPFLKDFMAPTQDIQASGIQQFVSLTPESLSTLGGVSSDKKYAPSEISDISGVTDTSGMSEMSSISDRTKVTPESLEQKIRKRAERQQQDIEQAIAKNKAEIQEQKRKQLEENPDLIQKVRERRKQIQPEEEEVENNEWEDEPDRAYKEMMRQQKRMEQAISQQKPNEPITERTPIEESKRIKKREQSEGGMSELEKEYKLAIEQEKKNIELYKQKLQELRSGEYNTDEEFERAENDINVFEGLISEAKKQIKLKEQLIEEEQFADVELIQPKVEPKQPEGKPKVEPKQPEGKPKEEPKQPEGKPKEEKKKEIDVLETAKKYRVRLATGRKQLIDAENELEKDDDISISDTLKKQGEINKIKVKIRDYEKWFEKNNIPINLPTIKEEEEDKEEGVRPRPTETEIAEKRKQHNEMLRDKRKYVKMQELDETDDTDKELLKDRIGALKLKIDNSKKWFKSYDINITG